MRLFLNGEDFKAMKDVYAVVYVSITCHNVFARYNFNVFSRSNAKCKKQNNNDNNKISDILVKT